jgi:cytidylate kinase
MAIITISRELAALGDETARELAKILGYRLVDKRTLEERIKSNGMEDQKLKKYDERKPGFLASLSQDRDDYLHYLKGAMLAEAEQGSCIFIGRGASVVFHGMPGVVSIFLVASLEIRIERVRSYFHCDEKRARQIIERSDQDRTGFHRYFFDVDWKENGNYHLSLNTAFFHPAVCAEIVKGLEKHIFTPEMEAQSAARLKELILGQQVKHHIIYEREVPVHFLETSVSGDIITLYGVANSQAPIEAAINAAREAAGSAQVQSDIQIVREFSMIP